MAREVEMRVDLEKLGVRLENHEVALQSHAQSCASLHKRHSEGISAMREAINGNPSSNTPGLVTRLDRLEQVQMQRSRIWTATVLMLITILVQGAWSMWLQYASLAALETQRVHQSASAPPAGTRLP